MTNEESLALEKLLGNLSSYLKLLNKEYKETSEKMHIMCANCKTTEPYYMQCDMMLLGNTLEHNRITYHKLESLRHDLERTVKIYDDTEDE